MNDNNEKIRESVFDLKNKYGKHLEIAQSVAENHHDAFAWNKYARKAEEIREKMLKKIKGSTNEELEEILCSYTKQPTSGDYAGYGDFNERGANYMWNGPEIMVPNYEDSLRQGALKEIKKRIRKSKDSESREHYKERIRFAKENIPTENQHLKGLLLKVALIGATIVSSVAGCEALKRYLEN
ncbi:MAG: hypothetical protein AABX30_02025 [Nanoarchaeota archaeon]